MAFQRFNRSLHSIHSKKRIIENLLSVVKSSADGFIHLLTNPNLLQTNLDASSGLISLDFFQTLLRNLKT